MLSVFLYDFIAPFFHLCPERFASEIVLDESSQKPIGKVEDNNARNQVDQSIGNCLERKKGLPNDQKCDCGSEASQCNSQQNVPPTDLFYCGKGEDCNLAAFYQDGLE